MLFLTTLYWCFQIGITVTKHHVHVMVFLVPKLKSFFYCHDIIMKMNWRK